MRKNKLLIAAAIAALTAGSGLAFAQGTPDRGASGQGGMSQSPGASDRGTTGQAPSGQMQQEQKKGQDAEQKGQKGQKGQTTGQAPGRQQGGAAQQGQQEPSAQQAPGAEPAPGTQQGRQAPGAQQGQQQQQGQTTSVQLTTEQRTQIHQVVLQQKNVPHVTNVNFDLRVGAVVPRTVQFVDVPEAVIRIHPRFRRHKIFIVRDEIVIVEPTTLKIVAIITV